MDKFVKLAEIVIKPRVEEKEILEGLENKGFQVCLENSQPYGKTYAVMKKSQ